MTTNKSNNRNIPTWYWVVSAIFVLWNLVGVLSFFVHTFMSEEAMSKLPVKEQELFGEYPLWTSIIFAIAVFGGLLGSIGLLMKKKWSKMAFIISLCAIIPQMIHNVFFTKSMEVYGPGKAALMPVMVVVIGIFLVWFSNDVIKRDWLQ